VHAAQVVSGGVLVQPHEVGAALGHPLLGADMTAPGPGWHRAYRQHPGQDPDDRLTAGLVRAPCEPGGAEPAHEQRTDEEPSTPRGRHLVARAERLPRFQATKLDVEVLGTDPLDRLGSHREQTSTVDDLEAGRALAVPGHLQRIDAAARDEPARDPERDRVEHDEQGQRGAYAGQPRVSPRQPKGDGRDGEQEDPPAATRETHGQAASGLGTDTLASKLAMTSDVDTPAMVASRVSSRRWASTGSARRCTSLGTT
jgi:hypothetical protein